MTRKNASNYPCCGTCSSWCGQRTPDAFMQWVTFEDEKAKCAAYPGRTIEGHHAKCSKWSQQFKKR